MTVNRRRLLGWMGVAMVAPALLEADEERRVERIGLQLYTVRNLLAKDVAGTLAAVAAAGYTEVETAGYASLAPVQFAQALKQAGLAAPSAHVRLQELDGNGTQVLEAAAVLGHRFLVVPVPDFRASGTLEDYQRLAERLNHVGAQCAAAGIQLAYHNHDFEFAATGGVRPYDVLLQRCDAALVKFELDLFWASKAGADPASILAAAPERFPLCHVKDMTRAGEMVAVGEGSLDFAALFRAGTGLRHHFVEHDNPADPLASVRRSIATVRTLRF